jgi:hypothetical protein
MKILAVAAALAVAQASASPQKVPIVSVSGCLKEAPPGTWTLTNATSPAPSSANAVPPNEVPKTPAVGTNQFRLIGVSEFNLPAHKDHAVILKGLLIAATPVSRLNLTSVTMVAPNCPAAP